jgi:hypothetical protein
MDQRRHERDHSFAAATLATTAIDARFTAL